MKEFRFRSNVVNVVGVAAAAALAATTPACDYDDVVVVPERASSAGGAPALAERTFARTEGLRAAFATTVVLELEPPGAAHDDDTGTAGVDVVPYRVAAEQDLNLCLRDLGGAVSSVTLRDGEGRIVADLPAEGPCVAKTLAPGDYDLSLVRAAQPAGAAPAAVPVFVHAVDSRASTALQQATQVGCTEAENATNPTSMHPSHRWYVTLPSGVVDARSGADFLYVEPFRRGLEQGDLGKMLTVTKVATDTALFSSAGSGYVVTGGPVGATTEEILELLPGVDAGRHTAWRLLPKFPPYTFDPVVLGDRGSTIGWLNYQDVFFTEPLANGERTSLTFGMRYVPDASTIDVLRSGEVALYERCDHQGKAVVLNTSNAFPPNIDGAAAYLGGSVKSIKLSCDAYLEAWARPDFMGGSSRILRDLRCIDYGDAIRSVRVRSSRAVVIETGTCDYCNLRGVDLRGVNLRGADLSNADLTGAHLDGADASDAFFTMADLTDATFTRTNLTRANVGGWSSRDVGRALRADFSHANFTEARLSFADMSRAKFDDANFVGARLMASRFDGASFARTSFVGVGEILGVELTNTDLTTALIQDPKFGLLQGESLVATPCSTPRNEALSLTRLAGTRFSFRQFPSSTWRYIDFTDARGDATGLAVADKDLARRELCGLKLGGLVFDRWNLSEANLANADLARTTFRNTDLRFANFTGVVLSGASVTYSDLTSAKLDDVIADSGSSVTTFSGSRFAPASMLRGRFSNAVFARAAIVFPAARSGARFVNAKFNDVNFTEADLTGLDMTGSTFSNAVFHRAVLKDAIFGPNAVLRDATFCGAKVEDADFRGSALEGALIPEADVLLPNLVQGQPDVTCAHVDLGAKPSLDAAVLTTDAATCPNGDTLPKGASCTLAQFTRSTPEPIVRCLLTKISDGAGLACTPCSNACDCDSKVCTGGICGPCSTP